MNILEILNKEEEIKNLNLKLNKAELTKNNFLKVVFACLKDINDVLKNKIYNIIKDEIGNDYYLKVEYELITIKEDDIFNFVNKILFQHHSIVCERIKLDNNYITVYISNENESVNEKDIINELGNTLTEKYHIDFTINFEYCNSNNTDFLKIKQKMELNKYIEIINAPDYFNINNIKNIIGDININKVSTIESINSVGEDIYLCGSISYMKEFLTKDKEVNGQIIPGKPYYSFYINDGFSTIRASIFPNEKNKESLKELKDGLKVICCGKVDEYNNKFNYMIRSIAKCEYSICEKPDINVPEPKYYLTVKPETYEETSQLSLFSMVQESNANNFLMNNSFVVFDFETTGLEYNNDAVTELGAVKVVNGRITETFSTFVNPLRHIPDKITELTHITDDMVKDAPLIEDVLIDFYKFCYGSSLVAHNIDFDFKFLNYNAKKIGIIYKNKQYDTLMLAKEYIKGIKNYKLGTICEYLGVELVDAHRAVNDCLATAKVFIKLSDYIK